MATLRGKITDVTHKPPESLSSITVKAPSVRVGGGTDLIVSSPATVDFDRGTGDVTISGLTGGLSWLYLEGEGWSDSIALSVAEGMISLVEAIANASSAPGIVEYLRLLAEFKIRFDETAQDAVDAAAENINWVRPRLSMGDDLNLLGQSGVYEANRGYIMSSLLNRPEGAANQGVVEHVVSGDVKFQRLIHSTPSQVEIWQRVFYGGQWSTWERVNPPKAERLTTGTDLDSLVEQEVYQVPNFTVADSLIGKPDNISGAISHAVLEVLTNGSRTVQRWTTLPTAATKSITVTRHRDTVGDWSAWELATVSPDSLFMDRGVVSEGTDLNTLVSVGLYRVNNFTAAQSFINGPPENARHRGVITVTATGTGEIHQRWQRMSQVGQPQTEMARHRDENGTWSEWMRPWELGGVTFGSDGGSSQTAVRMDMLRQNSRIRRGGVVGTGGAAPIALTFDHGFVKFRDLILPYLIEYGLPATVAFNPDTMNTPENEGVTWDDLQDWSLNYGIELAHHGRLHASVDDALTNQEAVEHQFISTIDEIRANCPEVISDAFILPGSGGGGHQGFGNGLDGQGDSLWWTHPVGRTILSNFPVVTGDLRGVTVPVTGQPVQTIDRISLDYNSGIITVREKIRSTFGTSLGAVLFMHPNLLDDGTHTDAYRIQDFLQWLAIERERGNLEVLTLSGFAWATADSARRFDLMRDKWVGDSATADLDLVQWIRGAQMCASATADTDGPLTISATDPSGTLAALKTIEAGAGEKHRLYFSIPRNAESITVSTSGSEPTVYPT